METSTARSPYQELEGRSVAPPAGRRPLNLGGTTKRSFALVPTAGTGAFFFSPAWEFSPIRPDLWKNAAAKPAVSPPFPALCAPIRGGTRAFCPAFINKGLPEPSPASWTCWPQRSLSSSGGPAIEFQSSGVNPADCKVFAFGKNTCTPHSGRSGQQLPTSYQQRSFPPCPK